MELEHLKYFLVVANEKNITYSASKLHLTQPTLSRIIRQLEEEYGQQLFIRTNKNVELTEAGLLLQDRATALIGLADKTKNDLRTKSLTVEGDIYIGAVETESSLFLYDFAREFHDKNGKVRFSFFVDEPRSIIQRMNQRLLDFAFITSEFDRSKYNVAEIPNEEEWGIVCKTDDPLATRLQFTVEEVAEMPLIIPYRILVDRSIKDIFHGKRVPYLSTYTSIFSGLQLVLHDMGKLFCMKRSDYSAYGLKFVPIIDINAPKTYFIWDKSRMLNTASQCFLTEVLKKYGE